ncbi:protease complex subunit PrcB family protein [Paenactinomyces guangxiensis]|uniref:Protease complex subunit PrcB family protein n=1 Tax=Paenactinomyces guangxiensis TaxID=1490290 RepID=A0A7W1WN00_9BACL|nr:protease complex subunit PrcB family protein [Paenactinomyces guangxiensis]MBA4492912.1 protease complex subunit PrcB family protein [Paenactinomyces guangxiensis]MBH8590239.1 protease complex subunit PrcB family protein [Paenactinomyces guangxiensis]
MKGCKVLQLLLFATLFTLMGCGTGDSPSAQGSPRGGVESGMKEQSLKFEKVTIAQLPESLHKKAKEMQKSPHGETFIAYTKPHTYIMIGLGERNTGGYSIQVKKVIRKGRNVTVYAEETTPPKGGFVTQAITNPFTIISVENKDQFDHVEVKLKKAPPSKNGDAI